MSGIPLRDKDVDLVRLSAVPLLRADDADGMPLLEVRFAPFDQWYEIESFWEGHFLERVAKGAFKRTIKNNGDQVRSLYDHGFDFNIGNKVLGPIEKLSEEDDSAVGLVRLLDTQYNHELIPGLRAGVYGSSHRFRVLVDEFAEVEAKEWEDTGRKEWAGLPQRTIKEVRLFEFGPVTFPANPAATAGIVDETDDDGRPRSLTDAYYERLAARAPRDVERIKAHVIDVRGIDLNTDRTSPAEPVQEDTSADEPATSNPSGPGTHHPDTEREADTVDLARTRGHADMPRQQKTDDDAKVRFEDRPLSVDEREARKAEIKTRMQEIDTEHSGAALDGDAEREWNELEAEYEAHDRAIADMRKREARIRELVDEGDTDEGVEHEQRRTTSRARREASNVYDLAEIRRQAYDVDDLPRLYRDHALRAIESAHFPGHNVNREDAQANVVRLLNTIDEPEDGAKGVLARRILATGSPVYRSAFRKYTQRLSTAGLTNEEARALSVGSPAAGGFAVPFQLDPTIILSSAGSSNPLRQISRVESITGKEWQGITSDGVTVSRANEAAEASDNSPTLVQPTVKAERVQGFIPYSMEIDQDWAGLEGEMTRLLQDAKDNEEANSFINGNGTPPNANGLLPALQAGQLITANSLTLTALYDLENALPERFVDNARFLAHRGVYTSIRQFDPDHIALVDAMEPSLLGYPRHRTSAMPDATLAIGDRYLLFGDFRNFLIVDRVGMIVDTVPHLFGAAQRPTGQRGLFALWRNNCKVLVLNAFRALNKTA